MPPISPRVRTPSSWPRSRSLGRLGFIGIAISSAWVHAAVVDPRRLMIFRTVVRAGALGAAARELGWTQPAVSQQLRQLERETGCTLLLRGPRGVTPTEAGTLLVARADAVAAQLAMAEEEVADVAALRRGRGRCRGRRPAGSRYAWCCRPVGSAAARGWAWRSWPTSRGSPGATV